MTEADAHKFIYRWTPRRHRCEVTRARIRRIQTLFSRVLVGSAAVVAGSWVNLLNSQYFRLTGLIVGTVGMLFALEMLRRTQRVRRTLYPHRPHSPAHHHHHHRHHHHHPASSAASQKEMPAAVDKTSVIV